NLIIRAASFKSRYGSADYSAGSESTGCRGQGVLARSEPGVAHGREAWHETAAASERLRGRGAGQRRVLRQLSRLRSQHAGRRPHPPSRRLAPGPPGMAAHLVHRPAVAPDARASPRRDPVGKRTTESPRTQRKKTQSKFSVFSSSVFSVTRWFVSVFLGADA